MPKREDIKKILIIGSGPIVIGQACEFDYSGTQAAKSLRDEGYEVVLINSNPATIMTDPEFADRTYIEPITTEYVETVIARERPDAVLGTMGGQTGLNVSLDLFEKGILDKYNCELIGAKPESIVMAEDREHFRRAMDEIGLESAKSFIVRSLQDADKVVDEIGFPLILRPSRTLGGTGGGIANDKASLKRLVAMALQASPNNEVLVEESLLGWKEIELEVMRDNKDNVVIVCGIENFDPMGVHTGDSITVAPIQTLTDKEYQRLRDASIKIMQKIGVDTGGSNVQFSIDPKTGRFIVIEMNPRVSRSSALASKATGFPIAKISAKLAVGYTLDEIENDITRVTPASFEPALDYTIVKIPRFTFEKFPQADAILGTQMKSVGEAMSFGRTFQEALQKAIYSLETDSTGFDFTNEFETMGKSELLDLASVAAPQRLWAVGECFRKGASLEEVYEHTKIDTWFLYEVEKLIKCEQEELSKIDLKDISPERLREYKVMGFCDRRIAEINGTTEKEVRELRYQHDIVPEYNLIDTCAGEFEAYTPYFYGTYEESAFPTKPISHGEKPRVVILGSGPNRIGQGIEFDYCCVHTSLALRESGFESIMINCNPETVSTDYDTSDRLYFEPLTLESVLNICRREKPQGVIVQFGGQTPLKLAAALAEEGIPILGTTPQSIDLAEDRERFASVLKSLSLLQTEFSFATSKEEAITAAENIGYPLVIRPSFVLGGRAMKIVFDQTSLVQYMDESVQVSHERPVLLDRFLDNAIEIDLDAVSDGKDVVISGVMEHIERAGIHSGDSSCCLPPHSISDDIIDTVKKQAKELANALEVKGLMNIQFAVTPNDEVYVLEVNPRASRTIPFVSKATGIPWAKIAALVISGTSLHEAIERYSNGNNITPENYWAVKACVFPFQKFPGVDTILGPEMKSTGEVMGIGQTFAEAFGKSQLAAGIDIPEKGKVFLSVRNGHKEELLPIAKKLIEIGFSLTATSGTATYLSDNGVQVETVRKVSEGSPHIVDMIGNGEIQLVINTPEGEGPYLDSRSIRLVSNEMKVPLYTTLAAAHAATEAISLKNPDNDDKEIPPCDDRYVYPLQELY